MQTILKLPRDGEVEDADRVARSLGFALREGAELILFVGGSAVREYPPADEFVSARLTKECGRELRFVGLGASNQTFAETWALIEAASRGRLRTVLYGMTYARFEYDLVSIAQSLDNMLTPVPRPASLANWLSYTWLRYVPTSAWLSDSARALRHAMPKASLARVWRFMSTPPLASAPVQDPFQAPGHFYKTPVMSGEDKALIANQYLGSRILPFAEGLADSTRAWQALIQNTAVWGANPALVILPEDPSMAKVDRFFRGAFDRAIKQLETAGAAVYDMRDNPRLTAENFFDQQHLVASGRRIEFDRLIAIIKSATPGCSGR